MLNDILEQTRQQAERSSPSVRVAARTTFEMALDDIRRFSGHESRAPKGPERGPKGGPKGTEGHGPKRVLISQPKGYFQSPWESKSP
jgi:hypothetical protein